ncbi:MAG: DNA polymerase I, partial [Clostridia bacterium]|nr:DNA polymerase I [Clostridia bacterium]
VRMRAERASQNMPLQGTAADIIKIAMVNIYDALCRGGFKAKLIMQVHDELIIDCPIEEKDAVCELLKKEMVNAASLKVPLEIDIATSYRWSDGH